MAEEWLFPLKVIDMSTHTWEIEFHYLFFQQGLTEYSFKGSREHICITEYIFFHEMKKKKGNIYKGEIVDVKEREKDIERIGKLPPRRMFNTHSNEAFSFLFNDSEIFLLVHLQKYLFLNYL